MPDEQFTIVREGDIYHTDIQTVALLTAAQRYDAQHTAPPSIGDRRMQDVAFDHAYESGRIAHGPAYAEEQHDMRHGEVGMTAKGVRLASGLDVQEAIHRGLVVADDSSGYTIYRATPKLARTDIVYDGPDRAQTHSHGQMP